MFDRVRRRFDLVRASGQVLKQDDHLLFPLIPAGAWLLAAFALRVFGLALVDGIGEGGAGHGLPGRSRTPGPCQCAGTS